MEQVKRDKVSPAVRTACGQRWEGSEGAKFHTPRVLRCDRRAEQLNGTDLSLGLRGHSSAASRPKLLLLLHLLVPETIKRLAGMHIALLLLGLLLVLSLLLKHVVHVVHAVVESWRQ
jgi:hypothetical protein